MSKDDERVFETEDSHKFSHYLREGMEYCKNNPAEVGDRLAGLKDKIRLEIRGSKVIARLRFQLVVKSIGLHSQSYPEITSIGEIITVVIKDKHLNEWKFPSLHMDSIDISKLKKWADAENKLISQQADSLVIKNGETLKPEEHRD